jgi:Uma2 family endonuclease
MSLITTKDVIEYPESDDKPIGETDVHIDWMVRIRDILRYRYRGQRVYVTSNLLLYYQEGDPTKFVVPDIFVVKDCDPQRRRTFKMWEEGKAPDVAFEVTSRSSRRDDMVFKPQIYARIGVHEYFLYDPTAEYLATPLLGFRLTGGEHQPIQPDRTGALKCEQLDIALRLEAGNLVMHDSQSGQRLYTEAEAAQAAHLSEKTARQSAEGRVAELEAELQRLRAQFKQSPPQT